MKVLKFGGTSVKDAGRIRSLEPIILANNLSHGIVVICSAQKGVTDDLLNAAKLAAQGDETYTQLFNNISTRHLSSIHELLGESETENALLSQIKAQLAELAEILHGVYLIKEASLRTLDLVMSFGERLNNQIIAGYFSKQGHRASYVDARPLVLTDDTFGNAQVQFEETYSRIKAHFNELWGAHPEGAISFVSGFVGATKDGITTTLGRNGSDYSGSIFGAGVDAEDIEIWTDVDGVMTCDPRLVKEAFVIDDVTVEEAMEMSYFGAEVIHPYTMIPAIEKNIPIWIKNTMNPSVRGTRIARDKPSHNHPVTGLAIVKQAALLNVVGGGMVGAKGIAGKIFTALAKTGTNIIMISQASSEHSISVVIRENEVEKALVELKSSLEPYLLNKSIQTLEVKTGLEILSVIGANMKGQPGVSGRLFSALGKAGINILAIAQGLGEMNISLVIDAKHKTLSLQKVHEEFFPEAHK